MATAIAGGSVAAVGTIIFKVLKTVGKGLWFVLKIVTKVLFVIFKNLFILFSFLFNELIGILIFISQKISDLLRGNTDGIRKPRFTLFDDFLFYAKVIIDEIKALAIRAARPLLVFLIIIIVNLASFAIFLLLGYILSFFYPVLFFIIDVIIKLGNFLSQILVLALNLFVEVLSLIAPSWNELVLAMRQILNQILKLICDNQTLTFTGDLKTDCKPFFDTVTFISTTFQTIVTFFTTLLQTITTAYSSIGDITCPGGACSAQTCIDFGMPTGCEYSPVLSLTWLSNILSFLIKFILPVIKVVVYFLLDIVIFFINLSVSIFGLITSQDSFSQFIKTEILNGGAMSLVEKNAQEGFIKEVFLVIEGALFSLLGGAVAALREVMIMVDYFVCNFVLGYETCLASKICYTILPVIDFKVGLIPIFLDLKQLICADILNLSIGNCVCNICKHGGAFTVVFSIVGLLDANDKLDVPCNGEASCSGCNSNYSILRFIVPL